MIQLLVDAAQIATGGNLNEPTQVARRIHNSIKYGLWVDDEGDSIHNTREESEGCSESNESGYESNSEDDDTNAQELRRRAQQIMDVIVSIEHKLKIKKNKFSQLSDAIS